MMQNKKLILIISTIFLFLTETFAASKVALVVGNNKYNSSPLENPVKDAKEIASKLKGIDFDVTDKYNLSTKDFDEALKDFYKNISGCDLALIYFSGHGIQANNKNYLIPISSEIKDESDLERHAISLQSIIDECSFNGDCKNLVIILDACRDNPLGKSRGGSNRGMKNQKLNNQLGTMIFYSTGGGQTASDGDKDHSPFTQALLNHIDEAGKSFEEIANIVIDEVLEKTNNLQRPEKQSNAGAIYLNGGSAYFSTPSKIEKKSATTILLIVLIVIFSLILLAGIGLLIFILLKKKSFAEKTNFNSQNRETEIYAKTIVEEKGFKKQNTFTEQTISITPNETNSETETIHDAKLDTIVDTTSTITDINLQDEKTEIQNSPVIELTKTENDLTQEFPRADVDAEIDFLQDKPKTDEYVPKEIPIQPNTEINFENTKTVTEISSTENSAEENENNNSETIYIEAVNINKKFLFSKFLVTNKLYSQVTGSECDRLYEYFPVTNVTYLDAIQFCNALSKMEGLEEVYSIESENKISSYPQRNGWRLPYEIEWKEAFGDKIKDTNINDYAWTSANSDGKICSVGLKKANRFGIFDMAGLVREWCNDFYCQSGVDSELNSKWKILKGGAWDSPVSYTNPEVQDRAIPSYKSDNLGFRIMRNA